MLKIVKYVNIMNIRLNFIELFFISVIMVYKCIVFLKKYVFKMDFWLCFVMKVFKCDVMKIKEEKNL